MEIQTRKKDGSLRFFSEVKNAFDFARDNEDVWKISFGGVRLVKVPDTDGDPAWSYQPMSDIVQVARDEADRVMNRLGA